ncbi:MAG: hypothetical protein EBR82_51195 [Caulobacteraceae bacterium]|nr:hypothetical protein [Caulobacteraceae bacterium]
MTLEQDSELLKCPNLSMELNCQPTQESHLFKKDMGRQALLIIDMKAILLIMCKQYKEANS